MKWIDYKFPIWIAKEIQHKIIEANPDFEAWSVAPRALKIYAVAELARLPKIDSTDSIAGRFIYYKDNCGFIINKHDEVYEVKLEKTVMIRPQMIKYSTLVNRSKAKLGIILDTLIELDGKMLQSLRFVSAVQLLIEIPIGTKAEFEKACKVRLDDMARLHVN